MIFLRSIEWKTRPAEDSPFPFSLPAIAALTELSFTAPVTFFVGENGSGKSTLLEAIAAGIGSIAIGSESIEQDATLGHARQLARRLKFVKNQAPRRGFFFRAEDIFGFTKRVIQSNEELDQLESDFGESLQGYGRDLALGAVRGQRAAQAKRYGQNPDAKSHGESFLHLFQARMVPSGFYLLDEPETPLSPLRQLTFLSILKAMVAQDCQFIIATHSPILMAFPQAAILHFDENGIQPVAYDAVEHVSLTKAFLNNPQSFLSKL